MTFLAIVFLFISVALYSSAASSSSSSSSTTRFKHSPSSSLTSSTSFNLSIIDSTSFISTFNPETIQEKLDGFTYNAVQKGTRFFSPKVYMIANKISIFDHLTIFTNTVLFHSQPHNEANSAFALSYLTYILKDLPSEVTLIELLVDCLRYRTSSEIIELILSKQKAHIKRLSSEMEEEIFVTVLKYYFTPSYDQIIKIYILFAKYGFDFDVFKSCKIIDYHTEPIPDSFDSFLHFAPLIKGLFCKPVGMNEIFEMSTFLYTLQDLFTVNFIKVIILSDPVFIFFDKILSYLPSTESMTSVQIYNLHRFIFQLAENVGGPSYEGAEIFLCSCCRNDLSCLLDYFLQVFPNTITSPHELAHLLVQAKYSFKTQHILRSRTPPHINTEYTQSIIGSIFNTCEMFNPADATSDSSSVLSSDCSVSSMCTELD